MKIKWLGHSCFLLTSGSNVKILTDPFDDTIGYDLPVEEADIVTTSHKHYDHNNIEVARGDFTHLDSPGKHEVKGITITGVSTWHDDAKGSKRGENIVYIFEIDGLRVCHCGDLGHVFSPQQVAEAGHVDILLVPVGGIYTVDAFEALKIVKQLKPAVTIPMHFKTEALSFSIDTVDNFLTAAKTGERAGRQEMEFSKENITNMPEILVLDYK